MGGWLIPSLIARYREISPKTAFELRGDAADAVIDDIRNSRVDLGFVSPEPTGSDLVWTQIATEELFLLVPIDHRLAARDSASLAEVESDDFVGLSPQFGLRQVTDRLCSSSGFTPSWAMTCTEVSTVRALVAAGLGVSVVPAPHGDGQGGSRSTRLLRITGVTAARPIGVVVVEDHLRAPALLRFYESVQNLAGNLGS